MVLLSDLLYSEKAREAVRISEDRQMSSEKAIQHKRNAKV